jgi:hypothetical protein
MIYTRRGLLVCILLIFLSANATSQNKKSSVAESDVEVEKRTKSKRKKKVKLPEIDLSHWKVTLPIGSPNEVGPPDIFDYATNDALKPYMFNDSTDGSIVFYTVPGKTTANTKYSRTELREQMVPGENTKNWTFSDGALMKGTMAMERVSRGSDGKYHKVIIMQIHGRLTNEQKELIGQKDNNAPPILKIYWQNGKIRVKSKVLRNLSTPPNGVLFKEAWTDDKGKNFEQEVGFRKFKLEVKVSDGKMVVSLNKSEFFVYDNASIKRWGVFENYFKAGNYLQTRDSGAFAAVKIYDLSVTH